MPRILNQDPRLIRDLLFGWYIGSTVLFCYTSTNKTEKNEQNNVCCYFPASIGHISNAPYK